MQGVSLFGVLIYKWGSSIALLYQGSGTIMEVGIRRQFEPQVRENQSKNVSWILQVLCTHELTISVFAGIRHAQDPGNQHSSTEEEETHDY